MNANSPCENIPPSGRGSARDGGAARAAVPASPDPAPSGSSSGPTAPASGETATAPIPIRAVPRDSSIPGTPSSTPPPPSSRGEAALSALQEFSKLAPGITSKLNLAADCILVIAASAVSTAGHGSWRHSAVVVCMALGVWMLGARALRHYDAWCEGLFGELAVTSVLVISVAVSLYLVHQVSPGHARSSGVATFLLLSWPGVWFVRSTVVAFRAWRHSPPEQVLIVGTGPLGRVTGEDVRDTGKHRQVFGYLSWKDETKARRLPAPVMGRWDELEHILKQSAVGEVYIAGNPAKNGEAMQAAIRTCERFGVPFALPAYGSV